MRIIPAVAALLAVALTSAIASAAAPSKDVLKPVTVTMKAENKSGENGTATLTQSGPNVVVVVSLTGAPAAAQPTHIHPGTCTKLNPAPEYPLTSITDGKSTTTLKNMKLSSLMGGKFSVNVHKSTDDLATYVSCGEIK